VQKSTHISTVMSLVPSIAPFSVRSQSSVPQPTYFQPFDCVRSGTPRGTLLVAGFMVPDGCVAQPEDTREALYETGLQPGSAGSTPLTCSLTWAGSLQAWVSPCERKVKCVSGQVGVPSTQSVMARWRVELSQPLT